MQSNNYCVILAGGKGQRLWPDSNAGCPKQFLDFFGTGRTLLQQTYDRFLRMMAPENIFLCTTKEYLSMVRQQLPDVPDANIVVEPVNRNTAPAVAWANLLIRKRNADARVVVSPSDQMVMNEDLFVDNITVGMDFVASNDVALVMGVKPTRPEPSYGYIQMGEASQTENVWRVQSFSEKPDRDFARMFVDSGEFLWNTGLFLFSTQRLYNLFIEVFSEDPNAFRREHPNYTIDDAIEFTKKNYASGPNISIDYAVLEKSEKVCVMTCTFGWADIGSWHSVYETLSKGEGDNVVIDSEVITDNCRNNVIKLPKGKLAVLNGLDGYIVVDRGDVLLVCKKGDSSALVRKFINEVRMKYGDKYL